MDCEPRTGNVTHTPAGLLRESRGFSLVELIVVMAIFIIVIMATSNAFNTLVTHSIQQTKIAESQTGGIVGLEMMRVDLEHAGYGLPWSFPSDITPTYTEPNLGASLTDAPSGVPRAVHTGDHQGPGGSDRLVIRSTVAGTDATAKKWTYATDTSLKKWNSAEDLQAGEKVIVVRSTNVDGVQGKQLVMKSATEFSTTYPPTAAEFMPQAPTDLYLVYGVNQSTALARPFNRVDYYIATPLKAEQIPQRCAPNTYTLYKGVVNHDTTSAAVTAYPLLDCVADMQVIFGVDTNGDGEVDDHVNTVVGVGGGPASAQEIRDQVKEVRVYVLAQEGKLDRSFTYPNQKVRVGDFASDLGQEFDLSTIGADWQHYRWRLYTIVVNPKNLAN
ncbi:type II secretion system GspH family protein [Geobacter hydrogenophilus]|uniref:PilW family protein n=1 Tax=Geobacter hydrogenophilus TaxID=40983 RepID=UPI001BDA29E6|nr:PilW family protein [Geobacter hydrogenophilus]MBT0894965.1 type II secretion system GspH family protein [Geobacter hydrogenophilus]